LPALARAFPDMRFVMLVRDLRAVVASQNSQRGVGKGKRPLLFYVRHWRKSVALAHHCKSRMSNRVTLVRYEDLVARPVEEMQRLCTFAGVEYAAELARIDGTSIWTHNSSYGSPGAGIFTDSTERWRKVLRPAEIEALEALAGPELSWMGYEVGDARRWPSECLDSDCEPAFEELSPWLKAFPSATYLRDPARRRAEYAAEDARRAVLEAKDDISLKQERDLFLVRGVLPRLREAWQR